MAIYVIIMWGIIHFGEEFDVCGGRKIIFNPQENQFS